MPHPPDPLFSDPISSFTSFHWDRAPSFCSPFFVSKHIVISFLLSFTVFHNRQCTDVSLYFVILPPISVETVAQFEMVALIVVITSEDATWHNGRSQPVEQNAQVHALEGDVAT